MQLASQLLCTVVSKIFKLLNSVMSFPIKALVMNRRLEKICMVKARSKKKLEEINS